MEKIHLSDTALKQLTALIEKNIDPAFGSKLLEFGSAGTSIAGYLCEQCDYLALTDKDKEFTEKPERFREDNKIQLIPDESLSEDCYFGRFHLVYTLFGFRGLPHLVDEIMRLRRLIIKGGKIAVIDYTDDDFSNECIKQLKRCGFQNFHQEIFEAEGKEAFLIVSEK